MERRDFLSNGLAAALAAVSDAAAKPPRLSSRNKVAVMAELRFPAGAGEGAARALAKLTSATRAEPGCSRYVVARDIVDPDLFHLSELWDDIAALADHFATPHMAVFSADARALGGSATFLKRIHISELADLKPAELEILRNQSLAPGPTERPKSC